MTTYSENEILPVAIKAIHIKTYETNGITMSELQEVVRNVMNPNGDDLKILPSHEHSLRESSDHFAQKVRNIVSNGSLAYTKLVEWEGIKNRRFFPIDRISRTITDSMIRFKPLSTKNKRDPGTILSGIWLAAAIMADSAFRTIKNVGFANKYALEGHISDLIEEQFQSCAISRLPLDFNKISECEDKKMLPSLGLIDDNGLCEVGNLQVICRFTNNS